MCSVQCVYFLRSPFLLFIFYCVQCVFDATGKENSLERTGFESCTEFSYFLETDFMFTLVVDFSSYELYLHRWPRCFLFSPSQGFLQAVTLSASQSATDAMLNERMFTYFIVLQKIKHSPMLPKGKITQYLELNCLRFCADVLYNEVLPVFFGDRQNLFN